MTEKTQSKIKDSGYTKQTCIQCRLWQYWCSAVPTEHRLHTAASLCYSPDYTII